MVRDALTLQAKALSSPTRINILKILQQEKNPLTITEISKKINSFNYSGVWQHINILEESGLVNTQKSQHLKGQPVCIDLTALAKDVLKLSVLLNTKK